MQVRSLFQCIGLRKWLLTHASLVSHYYAKTSAARGQLLAPKDSRRPRGVRDYVTTQWVKKTVPLYSFITLINAGRYSKFLHYCILRETCNKAMPQWPKKWLKHAVSNIWTISCDNAETVGCQLLLITNRKPHTGFRLVPTSMTLDDLERRNSPYFAFFTEFDCFAGQIRQSGWI